MADSFRNILDVQLKVSKDLVRWIDGRLRNTNELVRKEDPTSESCLVVGCLAIAREHHEAIVHLVDMDLIGPASSLVRVATEAFFRGSWLHRCAKSGDWEHSTKDGGIKRQMHRMMDDLRKFREAREDPPVPPKAWERISRVPHAGMMQHSMTSLISDAHGTLAFRERWSL